MSLEEDTMDQYRRGSIVSNGDGTFSPQSMSMSSPESPSVVLQSMPASMSTDVSIETLLWHWSIIVCPLASHFTEIKHLWSKWHISYIFPDINPFSARTRGRAGYKMMSLKCTYPAMPGMGNSHLPAISTNCIAIYINSTELLVCIRFNIICMHYMASNSHRCRFGVNFRILGADILVVFIIFFDKKLKLWK
jgi:hypothetical protein